MMIALLGAFWSFIGLCAEHNDTQLLVAIDALDVQEVQRLLEDNGSSQSPEYLLGAVEKAVKSHEATVSLSSSGRDLAALTLGGIVCFWGVCAWVLPTIFTIGSRKSTFGKPKIKFFSLKNVGSALSLKNIPRVASLPVAAYLLRSGWNCSSAFGYIKKNAEDIKDSINKAFPEIEQVTSEQPDLEQTV